MEMFTLAENLYEMAGDMDFADYEETREDTLAEMEYALSMCRSQALIDCLETIVEQQSVLE